ncbi:hypothetical protein [Paenibacillus sp. GCM10028914]|uniref:hypothetical protein n=1 Tax=Paenibacillus sp. GCM10028914 TaxID=3273416 RepID=UPI003615EAD7
MQLVKNCGYQLKPGRSILFFGVYSSVLTVQHGFFRNMADYLALKAYFYRDVENIGWPI